MRAAISALALALCSCDREPGFDERYSQAENQIEERSRELDEQLNDAHANAAAGGGSEVKPN